jgi:hypothetical protein
MGPEVGCDLPRPPIEMINGIRDSRNQAPRHSLAIAFAIWGIALLLALSLPSWSDSQSPPHVNGVSGTSGASPVGSAPLLQLTPPYKVASPGSTAAGYTTYSWFNEGSCSTSRDSQWGNPRPNETTGIVTGGGFTCALGRTTNGSRSAYFSSDDGLTSNAFTANWSGMHQVVYKWRITWNASGVLAHPSLQTGNDSVKIYLYGNICNLNTTPCTWYYSTLNHNPVFGGTPVWLFNGSGNFSSGQRDQLVTVSFLYNFTRGGQYEFNTGLNLTEYSIAHTDCSASGCLRYYAQSIANVDRFGDGAKVLSMSVG